jgi:putative toxin-antitoxin system antitoxin component (TIGR02293 family)
MLLKETVEVLGGRTALRRTVRTESELAGVIKAGMPVRAVASVVGQIAADRDVWATVRDVIVPEGTYKRRLKEGRLSVGEGERAARLALIFATARHVLGDDGEARRFLHEPHRELGGEKPIVAAETELGARQVEALLWKIYYGVPA